MNAKFTVLAAFVAIGALTGCGTGRGIGANIDRAINDLSRGVDSFEQAVDVLEELKGDMDEGTYKNQVEGLIRTTGQVGQLTYEGSLDFTRTRLIEDLENMKRRLRGQQPLPRKPVLASSDNVRIKLDDPARSTVTIVGWNLDTAAADREKYSVSVHNLHSGPRKIPADFVAYQGQYAVTVNVSKSGFPLEDHDSKIVFEGYDKDFEVVIVDSAPPPVHLVKVTGKLYVYDHLPPPFTEGSHTRPFEKTFTLTRGSANDAELLVEQDAGHEVRGEVELSLACDKDGMIHVRCDLKLFEGSIVEKRVRPLRRTEQLAFDVKPGQTEQRIGTAVYSLKKDRMELTISVSNQELAETVVAVR
jgi:hypothetical protein